MKDEIRAEQKGQQLLWSFHGSRKKYDLLYDRWTELAFQTCVGWRALPNTFFWKVKLIKNGGIDNRFAATLPTFFRVSSSWKWLRVGIQVPFGGWITSDGCPHFFCLFIYLFIRNKVYDTGPRNRCSKRWESDPLPFYNFACQNENRETKLR